MTDQYFLAAGSRQQAAAVLIIARHVHCVRRFVIKEVEYLYNLWLIIAIKYANVKLVLI